MRNSANPLFYYHCFTFTENLAYVLYNQKSSNSAYFFLLHLTDEMLNLQFNLKLYKLFTALQSKALNGHNNNVIK